MLHKKYAAASGVNNEISEVMEMVKDNPEAYKKLVKINEDIAFLNSVCFDSEVQ